MSEKSNKNQIILVLIVAALGYFVDIYDLVLFGVVKGESLQQIMSNASPEQIASTGKFLFNMQMLAWEQNLSFFANFAALFVLLGDFICS